MTIPLILVPIPSLWGVQNAAADGTETFITWGAKSSILVPDCHIAQKRDRSVVRNDMEIYSINKEYHTQVDETAKIPKK